MKFKIYVTLKCLRVMIMAQAAEIIHPVLLSIRMYFVIVQSHTGILIM
jgi:hypothetical protein